MNVRLALLLIGIAACSGEPTAPEGPSLPIAGRYVLVSVDGQPLPYQGGRTVIADTLVLILDLPYLRFIEAGDFKRTVKYGDQTTLQQDRGWYTLDKEAMSNCRRIRDCTLALSDNANFRTLNQGAPSGQELRMQWNVEVDPSGPIFLYLKR